MATPTDIRVMVPRVRRAVLGVASEADETLTDDQIKDLVADAIASIILYSGSAFGKQLLVTDDDNGIPTEYATSDALSLSEQTVVAAQAALDYFFQHFATAKTSQRIHNEAVQWEWSTSAQLMRDQLALLVRTRDQAIQALESGVIHDSWVSFLAVRDAAVSIAIEPWASPENLLPVGGIETDYRFG